MLTAKLSGDKELIKRIKKIGKDVSTKEAEKVLLDAAKIIADDARSRVNRGPTGNLEKAIDEKTWIIDTEKILVLAAVDRKIAPHAHLVEYGHELVVKGKIVGHVPAHPFWRPAVDAKAAEARRKMNEGIKRLIERATK